MTISNRKNIILLGSTGSIGTTASMIAARYPDRFRIIALACGHNAEKLAEQIKRFHPLLVSVKNDETREKLKEKIKADEHQPTILVGDEGLLEVASAEGADLLINGLVGAIGLRPTCLALERGIDVALANKETLVIGGKIVMELANEHNAIILPVDSEHSAIFQCLIGVGKPWRNKIRRIILTASGGPFWKSRSDIDNATPAKVLKHPNWDMGPKVTVDSATLMNKGLEVIEAKALFGLDDDQIEVVIHRQSIIHSMVEFTDGAVLAQMGLPEMELPIQFAMSFPSRLPTTLKPLDFLDVKKLTFEKPDLEKFPCLQIAREASLKGGLATAYLNGADEGAVELFLNGKIVFGRIPEIIENIVKSASNAGDITIDSVLKANESAKKQAMGMVLEC